MDIKELEQYGKLIEWADLKNYTTFHIGPAARALLMPQGLEQSLQAIRYLTEKKIPFVVLGNGSNVLLKGEEFDGVVLSFSPCSRPFFEPDETILAPAGLRLIPLSYQAMEKGLTGLEFASGIPGSVGGAIYMNAGAYKKTMGDILQDVLVYTPKGLKIFHKEDLDLGYRHSQFQSHPEWIILAAHFKLEKGEKEEISRRMEERKARRKASQPLDLASAGSTFRNPKEKPAWQIIEELGFRGKGIGGARISELHSNFIVNPDLKASYEDVLSLIELIQKRAREVYGLELYCEVERMDLDEKAEKTQPG